MSPMRRERYPDNWDEIARVVKEACNWQCQACGLQCRKPSEPFDTHRRTLTVAHYDHVYDEPEVFVVALCAPCHLRHDAHFHAQQRRKQSRRHHMVLFRLRRSQLTPEDIAALAADWPEMPDLEGTDIFYAEYGEPYGREDE